LLNFKAQLRPEKVKISIVNYLNTLPFRYGIAHSAVKDKIDLQEDIPSICAQKLKFKQVDVGLVPVALLPELDHYEIITDFCLGANGKVDSVRLYSEVPIEEIKTITLDYQSKSSITLTKVLCKFFWKKDVEFREAKPGFEKLVTVTDAAVVIGDRTFSLNGHFKFEYDLAEEWKKFTGLPFVFAAWVSHDAVSENFIEEFNAALSLGVSNVNAALAEYKPYVPEKFDPLDYLTKKISYDLSDEKRKALSLFLEYIGKL
jgi:chorismate dehydratase